MSHFILLDEYKYVLCILKKSNKYNVVKLHQTNNKFRNIYLLWSRTVNYSKINTTDVFST